MWDILNTYKSDWYRKAPLMMSPTTALTFFECLSKGVSNNHY